jgi:hypothetical protein
MPQYALLASPKLILFAAQRVPPILAEYGYAGYVFDALCLIH